MDVLHLYAQNEWHDPAFIVGTRKAIEDLRDALTKALAEGSAQCTAFVNDGEGYDLAIMLVDPSDAMRLALPYVDEIASSGRCGLNPARLWADRYAPRPKRSIEESQT